MGRDLPAWKNPICSEGLFTVDVQEFYVNVFRKVHNSKKWVDYTSKKALNRAFLTGNQLTGFFLDEREAHRKLLTALGEIK